MHVDIIQVPYDSGHREERQGRGPARYMEAGIVDALRSDGHDLSTIKDHFTLAACTVASYDPSEDPEGRVAEAGIQLLRQIVG